MGASILRQEGSPGVCSGYGQITRIELIIACNRQNIKRVRNSDEKRFSALWQLIRCEVSQINRPILSTYSIPSSGIGNCRCALTIAGPIYSSPRCPSSDREIVSRFGVFLAFYSRQWLRRKFLALTLERRRRDREQRQQVV